ncbi:MAG: hypothetical protein M0Q21_08640 [Ignavibacteriaceae bacterium]|nr:hypothetical protein [Ignavibacteriaceae bacterium]
MEETILKEILQEMKGFREDNKGLKSEIEKLRNETSLESQKLRNETSSELQKSRSQTSSEFEKLRSEMSSGLETLRSETISESQKLRSEMRSGFEKIESTFNKKLDDTNSQLNDLKVSFDELNKSQKGLKSSVEVMLTAFNDTRYELIKIKEYLATRVIWDNDSINIVAESGNIIYGTIKKAEKKTE